MEMDLKEYRGFLDQQMLRILGQMESPSQIFDYLYLVCVCANGGWEVKGQLTVRWERQLAYGDFWYRVPSGMLPTSRN